jgi:hypothetical protein
MIDAVNNLGPADERAEGQLLHRGDRHAEFLRDVPDLESIGNGLSGVNEEPATEVRRPVSVFDGLVAVYDQPRPRLAYGQSHYGKDGENWGFDFSGDFGHVANLLHTDGGLK